MPNALSYSMINTKRLNAIAMIMSKSDKYALATLINLYTVQLHTLCIIVEEEAREIK